MAPLRLALAQLLCQDGNVAHNMERITQVVKEYGNGHDVIVFPECYVTGFLPKSVGRSLAEPLSGPIVKQLQSLASDWATHIVVGFLEADQQQVYNTSVLVGAEGLLLAYRKIHLWTNERWLDPGDTVGRATLPWGKFGLLICYDIEFPEPARATSLLGTELIILTNGNMAPYGPTHRVAIRARAQENQVFVAMANRVGSDRSIQYVGGSCVADPYGHILAELGPDTEDVLSVDLDLTQVMESRRHYHYLKERRIMVGEAPNAADSDPVTWTLKTLGS